MAEFTPITTQEEFDHALAPRLQRERETVNKRYEGWKSPEEVKNWTSPEDMLKIKNGYDGQLKDLQDKLSEANNTIAARDKTIAGYETDSAKTRIAMETGLPYEMARRLTGDTEDAIRADAQSLKAAMGGITRAPDPLATGEVRDKENSRSAYRTLVNEL